MSVNNLSVNDIEEINVNASINVESNLSYEIEVEAPSILESSSNGTNPNYEPSFMLENALANSKSTPMIQINTN